VLEGKCKLSSQIKGRQKEKQKVKQTGKADRKAIVKRAAVSQL